MEIILVVNWLWYAIVGRLHIFTWLRASKSSYLNKRNDTFVPFVIRKDRAQQQHIVSVKITNN